MTDTTKIAVVVRDDLAVWQKLNVTAFLVSGFGTRWHDVVGEPYRDASGSDYLAMFGLPVLVFGADAAGIRRAFDRAQSRGLGISVYTDELFATNNDRDNREAVASVTTDKLTVAGFAVCGDRRIVDKALDRLELHP